MKTTLNVNDAVIVQLERIAARQGRTMSELVEMALRMLFQSQSSLLGPIPAHDIDGLAHGCLMAFFVSNEVLCRFPDVLP